MFFKLNRSKLIPNWIQAFSKTELKKLIIPHARCVTTTQMQKVKGQGHTVLNPFSWVAYSYYYQLKLSLHLFFVVF